MTTHRQIQANRKNARLSTGPKTQEGKALVCQNAIKHGILTKEVFVDEDRKKEFQTLRDAFYLQFEPEGQWEHFLLDRVINCAWRLGLTTRVEAQIIRNENAFSFEGDEVKISQPFVSSTSDAMHLLSRYESCLERSLYRAFDELKMAQLMRRTSIIETINLQNGFVSQKADAVANEINCNV